MQHRNCPQVERLCGEAVGFTPILLLGSRDDMEQIADAVHKIQQHAGELAKKQSGRSMEVGVGNLRPE